MHEFFEMLLITEVHSKGKYLYGVTRQKVPLIYRLKHGKMGKNVFFSMLMLLKLKLPLICWITKNGKIEHL